MHGKREQGQMVKVDGDENALSYNSEVVSVMPD